MSGGPAAVVSVGRVAGVVLSGAAPVRAVTAAARAAVRPAGPIFLAAVERRDSPGSGRRDPGGARRWKGPREGSARTCRTPDQLAGVPAVVERTRLGYALLCGACRVGGGYSRVGGVRRSFGRPRRRVTGAARRRPMAPYTRTSLRRQPESSSRSTRLETRTKESNVCASRWVPCRRP